MYERIGVWNGETSTIECDECYKEWAKGYLEEYKDEFIEEEQEDYKELKRTLKEGPMFDHLELMGKYVEIAPIYEYHANESGEWCGWCGKELYAPKCSNCWEDIHTVPIETPKHELLCPKCAKLQLNKDHFKALQEELQRTSLKLKRLWDKKENYSQQEYTRYRRKENELVKRIDLIRRLEQIQFELGIIDLDEITTN